MTKEINVSKKHGVVSYISLLVGVICFFIVFVEPTRIAYVGYLIGDLVTIIIGTVGIVLSVIGLAKSTEKNLIPSISLVLSLSFSIFWIVAIVSLFTGNMEFAP